MAFIACEKCGCQMSDKSEACPICGLAVGGKIETITDLGNSDISGESQKSHEIQDSEINEESKSKSKPIIIGIFCVVLIAILFPHLNKCERNNIDMETEYTEIIDSVFEETNEAVTEEIAIQNSDSKNIEMTPVDFRDNSKINGLTPKSTGYVFVEKTWVRNNADEESNILETITYGYHVDIIDIDGGWAKIAYYNGNSAYVSADYLINKNKFERFNTLFSSEYVRQKFGELKYHKALLYIAEKYNIVGGFVNDDATMVLQCYGIDFEKRFNDEKSVIVFDMAVPDSDDCRQWIIEFDKTGNILAEKQLGTPYDIEDIVRTSDSKYQYKIIGEMMDLP